MSGPMRVLSGGGGLLHGSSASRTIEADAQAVHAPHALMQRAGSAVARLALALVPHLRHCLLLAGPGNNGGDALVAATVLKQSGVSVQLVLLAGDKPAPVDAAWALQLAHQAGVPIQPALTEPAANTDLLIDGLLGLGTGRALQGALLEAARLSHRFPAPVLAIDLPSGLHPDTGQAPGDIVRASHTLSLLTLKPSLFTASGRDAAGEIWFDDLGVTADAGSACAELSGHTMAQTLPARKLHAGHKGSFGDVVVVGGAPGMEGAAALAAHAALAAGAGRVYLNVLGNDAFQPPRAELMRRQGWWLQRPEELGAALLVCGCGGGDAVAATLPALLAHTRRAVFDADALNAIAADPSLQQRLRARAAHGAHTVLTPHPLEAARLLACTTAEVQANRLEAAQQLADRLQCVVVLKGSGSVVAAPSERPYLNASGNARLATPGSGDVLAGWIGGAWAAAGATDRRALQRLSAACCWLHGRAAETGTGRSAAAGTGPLLAADLIEAMADASQAAPAA